jgi:hypothetical protein
LTERISTVTPPGERAASFRNPTSPAALRVALAKPVML